MRIYGDAWWVDVDRIEAELRDPLMPRRTLGLRTCTHPGCPVLTAGGACPEHTPSTAEKGYAGAWPARATAFLEKHPTCEDCGAPATDADHVPKRRDLVAMAVEDPDSDEYLHARCHPCHSRKTVEEDGGFGRPPGESW